MLDASAQERLRGGKTTDFCCQHVDQFGLSIGTPVGQGVLKVVPDAFVRV